MDLPYAFWMAEQKIVRANQHIDELREVVEFTTQPSGYTISPQRDPKTGGYGLFVGPTEGGLRAEIPLSFGDAIHNLNTALDYIWAGVVKSAGGNVTEAHFPRHRTRQNLADWFEPAKKYAAVQEAFPQTKNLILDRVRPYEDGDFEVWALNKLDNIDKHRLLIAAISIVQFGKLVATAEDGSVIDFSGGKVQAHGPFAPLGFRTPFKLNDDAEATVDVVIAEPEFFTGQPIVETALNLAEATTKAVQALREAFI